MKHRSRAIPTTGEHAGAAGRQSDQGLQNSFLAAANVSEVPRDEQQALVDFYLRRAGRSAPDVESTERVLKQEWSLRYRAKMRAAQAAFDILPVRFQDLLAPPELSDETRSDEELDAAEKRAIVNYPEVVRALAAAWERLHGR